MRPLLVFLLCAAAAGCGTPSAPTVSAPTVPAPPARGPVISGQVRDDLSPQAPGAGVPGVHLDIVVAGQVIATTTTNELGVYRIQASQQMRQEPFELSLSKASYWPGKVSVSPVASDATVDLTLVPKPVELRGVVYEPDLNLGVGTVSVEILNGSNKGKRVFNLVNAGSFLIQNVWGEFDLQLSARGYETTVVHVAIPDVAAEFFAIYPMKLAAPANRMTFTGTLCTVSPTVYSGIPCSQGNVPYPLEATHTLPHSAGSISLDVHYRYAGDYYNNFLNVEMRCGDEVIVSTRVQEGGGNWPYYLPQETTDPLTVTLPRTCDYSIRVFNYIADRKGGDYTTYWVFVDPKP